MKSKQSVLQFVLRRHYIDLNIQPHLKPWKLLYIQHCWAARPACLNTKPFTTIFHLNIEFCVKRVITLLLCWRYFLKRRKLFWIIFIIDFPLRHVSPMWRETKTIYSVLRNKIWTRKQMNSDHSFYCGFRKNRNSLLSLNWKWERQEAAVWLGQLVSAYSFYFNTSVNATYRLYFLFKGKSICVKKIQFRTNLENVMNDLQ